MKMTRRTDQETQKAPVTQQDSLRTMQSIQDAMERLFNDRFFAPFRGFGLEQGGTFDIAMPRVDISETEEEIKARAEVPGMDPKDINVEVTEDSLSISGTIDKSVEEKQENFYRVERGSGSFSREFMLPSKIDAESVTAEGKNGVITITMKKQPSEQKRRVEVGGS